jgi:hypothetical protein
LSPDLIDQSVLLKPREDARAITRIRLFHQLEERLRIQSIHDLFRIQVSQRGLFKPVRRALRKNSAQTIFGHRDE